MKKITLLLLTLLSLAANAQESYPYKRPVLMLGKTVTVVSNSFVDKNHYFSDFYGDETLRKEYKKNGVGTPDTELLGRTFTVAAVDSVLDYDEKNYRYKFTLQDAANEVIYYKYRSSSAYHMFAFEVKGGLDLPKKFYCDYIEKDELSSDPDKYKAFIDYGMFFWRAMNFENKIEYSMSFAIYSDYEAKGIVSSVTLVMENNKSIKKPIPSTFAKWHSDTSYKYEFSMIFDDKELQLIKSNKILGIRIEDKVIPFKFGQKLINVANCMTAIPLAKR